MRGWSIDLELAWASIRRDPLRAVAGAWAIAFATASLLFVLAVGGGLREYLESRLLLLTPAVWVEAPAAPPGAFEAELEQVKRRLLSLEGVTAASYVVDGAALLSSGRLSVPARLEGYQSEELAAVLPGAGQAASGRLPRSDGEVALGGRLADALNAAVGERIAATGAGGAFELRVVGILEAGVAAVDSRAAITTFDTAQALLGRTGRSGLALAAAPRASLERLRGEIQEATGLWVRPWYEENQALLEALAVEAQVMLWITLAALATAAVATASISLLRIAARRFELGVLQAAGASPANLVRTVLFETVAAALAGALFGLFLASGALLLFERIPIPLPPRFGLTYLPVRLEARHIAQALFAALAAAAAAALPPAVRAARIEPVEALRNRQ